MAFKCRMCGKCCRELRLKKSMGGFTGEAGKAADQYHEMIRQVNMQGPLYHLVPWEEMTIRLFEWEMPPMLKRAGELGVELNFRPSTGLYDDYGKAWVIMTWQLEHDECPLIGDDNKCRAYAQRAIVCGLYPFESEFLDRYFALLGQYGPDHIVRVGSPPGSACPEVMANARKTPEKIRLGDCLKMEYRENGEQLIWAYRNYRTTTLYFGDVNDRLQNSTAMKMHTGPMPEDRSRMVPGIRYLTDLKILPPGYTDKLLAKIEEETGQFEESLK